MLKLQEVDTVIKNVFNDQLVKAVDTVYEKKNGFYLLVISIHGLELDDTLIIHTKFIFPCNLEKTELTENKFSYLTNLKCNYKHREFSSMEELQTIIEDILNSNDFDTDLKDLSEFLSESPDSKINHYLYQQDVEDFSVYEVKYDPRFKIQPCEQTTYDFDINVNNSATVTVSVKKEAEQYEITFKKDEIKTVKVDDLSGLETLIGSELINLFSK